MCRVQAVATLDETLQRLLKSTCLELTPFLMLRLKPKEFKMNSQRAHWTRGQRQWQPGSLNEFQKGWYKFT